MFSRCTHCHAQQRVTTKQLRNNRGLLKCKQCGQRFDALATLSDKADPEQQYCQEIKISLGETTKPAKPWVWQMGSGVMLLILALQIGFFEGEKLLRQPQLRLALSQFCSKLNCRLPAYYNLDQWSISHSNLQAQLAHRYGFSALISNQGAFAQAFPNMKLTLMGFNGQPIAERVFLPDDYAPANRELAGDETREIQLLLVEPSEPVGGFTVSLL